MTIIRVRQNNLGYWLVIVGDILNGSFLTHNRAIDYARGVKL